ncbi:hypothetical protein BGZ82_002918, partial [Podila clonocystis]
MLALRPQTTPKKSAEVVMPPTDSVSELAFSKTQDFLAASSWDGEDGSKLVSGGADNIAQVLDMVTGKPTQFAVHEAPIKSVRWLDEHNIVATGSWDKTIK